MAEYVTTDSPGALTGAAYFDGTDAGTAMNPGTFTSPDSDENMLPAEQGAQGLVGPVTGAQHMPNAAQPGSTSL
jgi:hypothetical protein